MATLIVIHNFAVLGLFALENITTWRKFSGSRNRFTRIAISKEAAREAGGGWLWPVRGYFCNMTDSRLPILIMLVNSCIVV